MQGYSAFVDHLVADPNFDPSSTDLPPFRVAGVSGLRAYRLGGSPVVLLVGSSAGLGFLPARVCCVSLSGLAAGSRASPSSFGPAGSGWLVALRACVGLFGLLGFPGLVGAPPLRLVAAGGCRGFAGFFPGSAAAAPCFCAALPSSLSSASRAGSLLCPASLSPLSSVSVACFSSAGWLSSLRSGSSFAGCPAACCCRLFCGVAGGLVGRAVVAAGVVTTTTKDWRNNLIDQHVELDCIQNLLAKRNDRITATTYLEQGGSQANAGLGCRGYHDEDRQASLANPTAGAGRLPLASDTPNDENISTQTQIFTNRHCFDCESKLGLHIISSVLPSQIESMCKRLDQDQYKVSSPVTTMTSLLHAESLGLYLHSSSVSLQVQSILKRLRCAFYVKNTRRQIKNRKRLEIKFQDDCDFDVIVHEHKRFVELDCFYNQKSVYRTCQWSGEHMSNKKCCLCNSAIYGTALQSPFGYDFHWGCWHSSLPESLSNHRTLTGSNQIKRMRSFHPWLGAASTTDVTASCNRSSLVSKIYKGKHFTRIRDDSLSGVSRFKSDDDNLVHKYLPKYTHVVQKPFKILYADREMRRAGCHETGQETYDIFARMVTQGFYANLTPNMWFELFCRDLTPSRSLRDSRWGMRAKRIGEASHPGPGITVTDPLEQVTAYDLFGSSSESEAELGFQNNTEREACDTNTGTCVICLEGFHENPEAIVNSFTCCRTLVHLSCQADFFANSGNRCPQCRTICHPTEEFRRLCHRHDINDLGTVRPSTDTAVSSTPDYGRPRTYATGEIPQPNVPTDSVPLCCRRRTGIPPDFPEWRDRRMTWMPVPRRTDHLITAWHSQWVCLGCDRTVDHDIVHPSTSQYDCSICNHLLTWFFDVQSGRGAWKCTRCDDQAIDTLMPTDVEMAIEHRSITIANSLSLPRIGADRTLNEIIPTSRNFNGYAPPDERHFVSIPTNSWLYVPLLLNAAGLLNEEESHRWRTHSLCSDWWEDYTTALHNSASVSREWLAESLVLNYGGMVALERLNGLSNDRVAFLDAVNSFVDARGYIQDGLQEILLCRYLGGERAQQLDMYSDRFRRLIPRDSVIDMVIPILQGPRSHLAASELTWNPTHSAHSEHNDVPVHLPPQPSACISGGSEVRDVCTASNEDCERYTRCEQTHNASGQDDAQSDSRRMSTTDIASVQGQICPVCLTNTTWCTCPRNRTNPHGGNDTSSMADSENVDIDVDLQRELDHPDHLAEHSTYEDEVEPTAVESNVFLDALDLTAEFRIRVPTLKGIPKCIRGPYKRILCKVMHDLAREIDRPVQRVMNITRQWKLLLLLPRLLLHRPENHDQEGARELQDRIDLFDNEQYRQLLVLSRPGSGNTSPFTACDNEAKYERAANLIDHGQLSRAAKILSSHGIAPGTQDTFQQLSDPSKRPPTLSEPLPANVINYQNHDPVRLNGLSLLKNLRSTRKGGAPGPSGLRAEHLKPLIEEESASSDFVTICSSLARGDIPEGIVSAIVLCNMTALNKNAPGVSSAHGNSTRVRGLAVGEFIRRITAKTLAQQYQKEFETMTSPLQFGIASKGGVDAAVHLLQSILDQYPDKCITQIDGVGAYDHIKRASMLQGLANCPDAHRLLPFVMLSYGRQSTYLWTDSQGITHEIKQGEGGEQGDALMPALFSLGMHQGLAAARTQLRSDEMLIAYLDDLYIVSSRDRVRLAYDIVTRAVSEHCGIQPNLGKTVCFSYTTAECPLDLRDLGESVWKADAPLEERGIRILGCPFGSNEFVHSFISKRNEEENILVDEILKMSSIQHSWLLLYFCVNPRANHMMRQLPPNLSVHAADLHDKTLLKGLIGILGRSSDDELPESIQQQCSLSIKLGGLGLRNTNDIRVGAYWSSWADVFPVLCKRFPGFESILNLEQQIHADSSVAQLFLAHRVLASSQELPSWNDIINQALPVDRSSNDGSIRDRGWQYSICKNLESNKQSQLFSQLDRHQRARLRSCGGEHSARWLTSCPTSEQLQISNPIFQCLLRRRLGLPLNNIDCTICNGRTCHTTLDEFGHHSSTCTRSGRTHARHTACMRPWRQILEEAGYRVRVERMLSNTHLRCLRGDQRRMDLVAAPAARNNGARRGLALFCDITVANCLSGRGQSRNNAHSRDGAVIKLATNRKKNRTYRDVHASPNCDFNVLGCETYGRWSEDAISLVKQLAYHKSLEAPRLLRKSVQGAWMHRWWTLASICSARAIAETMSCHSGPDLITGQSDTPAPNLADLFET